MQPHFCTQGGEQLCCKTEAHNQPSLPLCTATWPTIAAGYNSLVQRPSFPSQNPRPAFELRCNASCCHPYSCALCPIGTLCNAPLAPPKRPSLSVQMHLASPPALLKQCPQATTSLPVPLTQHSLHPEPPCLGSLPPRLVQHHWLWYPGYHQRGGGIMLTRCAQRRLPDRIWGIRHGGWYGGYGFLHMRSRRHL